MLHPADLWIDGARNSSLFACRHAWTPAAMSVTAGLASDSHRPAGLAWGPFCPQGLGFQCVVGCSSLSPPQKGVEALIAGIRCCVFQGLMFPCSVRSRNSISFRGTAKAGAAPVHYVSVCKDCAILVVSTAMLCSPARHRALCLVPGAISEKLKVPCVWWWPGGVGALLSPAPCSVKPCCP